MKYNIVAEGIELLGTTVKNISVENNIVSIENEAKRRFGLNINEPYFEENEEGYYSEMIIDFELEIWQAEEHRFKMKMSLEGAFCSNGDINQEKFKQLVGVNGASAIIGIARGKIETITANVFNEGKVVIPFVNVIDYYRDVEK